MLTHLSDLMGHAEWANAVFFHAWGKSPARDHEELSRRVDHIVAVQEGFLSVLQGQAPSWRPDGPAPSFADLASRAQSGHTGLRAFVSSLTEESARTSVRIPWFPDPPCVISAAEAVVQVALHTQHHRGQCMTRLKDFGGEPKNVDWIIWLWKQKPDARWG